LDDYPNDVTFFKKKIRMNPKLLMITGRLGCIVLFVSILMLSQSSFAAEPRLILTHDAPVYGGSCQTGTRIVLAGSMTHLEIFNTSETDREPLVSGWPTGYTLEARWMPRRALLLLRLPG
jgi:hypothetical protein